MKSDLNIKPKKELKDPQNFQDKKEDIINNKKPFKALPKKIEEFLVDDENSKLRIDKFFLQILKSRKDHEPAKIPEFLNNKFNKTNQDLFEFKLSQFDLKLVNSIFSRRDEDLNKELKEIEFDIDFGSYEFQKKFYSKYVLIKQKNFIKEECKSKYLKIKVNLTNSNYIEFTQSRLSELLTKFRKIYYSYCSLKSFLSEMANNKFDERFDFEIFIIIEEEVKEKMVIQETYNSFDIKWKSYDFLLNLDSENPDLIDPILDKTYIRSFILSLFKLNIFSTVKTITGVFDLTKEKIAALLMREHLELFEYFLKNQKVMKIADISNSSSSNKKKSPQGWKASTKIPSDIIEEK